MSQGEVHVNDVGTSFQATIRDENNNIVDVSSATLIQMKFQRPDGTVLGPLAASFVTNGKDGLVQYVTKSGDMNMKGSWKVQGFVVLTSGAYYSDVYDFTVYRNL